MERSERGIAVLLSTSIIKGIRNKRDDRKQKPKVILDYDEAKSAVDLCWPDVCVLNSSVEMISKISIRIAVFELNTTVVNVLVLYKALLLYTIACR